MQIRKEIDWKQMEKFYPVLRKQNAKKQRKKKIVKAKNENKQQEKAQKKLEKEKQVAAQNKKKAAEAKAKVKAKAKAVEKAKKQKLAEKAKKQKAAEKAKKQKAANKDKNKNNKNKKVEKKNKKIAKRAKKLPAGAKRQADQKPKRAARKPKVEPAERKQQRAEKMQGQLLTQLQMLQQRIETMERDKQRYALVDRTEEAERDVYTILQIGDPTKVLVKVKHDGAISCSCMDWLIRCRNFSIPCKHIYYFLAKILTYELFDYFDNTIMRMDDFRRLVDARIKLDKVDFKPKEGDRFQDDMCPICYVGFAAAQNAADAKVLKCPSCKHFMHQDCMLTWMDHSKRRNCIICRSEDWNMLFAHALQNQQ